MNRLQRRTMRSVGWALCTSAVAFEAMAGTSGRVLDLNGQGLGLAMVTLTKSPQARGAAALTVFTDEHGAFTFPAGTPEGTLSVRRLGYKQVDTPSPVASADAITLLMQAQANQAGTAPASAYLRAIARPEDREALIDADADRRGARAELGGGCSADELHIGQRVRARRGSGTGWRECVLRR